MLLLDVNVLVAGHRDDHPDHPQTRSWLDRMLGGDEPFGVPSFVWGSFLRITTNRRIFAVPTPRHDAFAFFDALRAQPLHLPIEPGPRYLALLAEQCEEADANGDLIPDAVIAAAAAEHACTIVSLDRDFARFRSIPHRNPLDD